VHHGVRVSDGALVSAARLAHRYITDRFQPDKSIDLVDEAAARLRMQQESKPDPIDMLEREMIRKQMEIEVR
jgi:ATP-dependent Clp protease ATP-binding subunit ClpB